MRISILTVKPQMKVTFFLTELLLLKKRGEKEQAVEIFFKTDQ